MKSREPQRIAKLLARAGVASRREIERMIAEGRVALEGKTLDTPATVLASLHGVTVDGQPVQAAAPARLFRYHKPPGLLTTERDPKGRPTIYDRLPRDLPRVMPVGRLDLATEGLLLMTTDGELKRQLELPATGVERSYRARAYGQVTQAQLEELMLGVEIEGVRYGSINANLERRTGANVWIELTLTEGKNREVRRVLEYLGLQVSRLIRTRYGPFHLADMGPGQVDEIRQHDLVAFRKALAGPGGGKTASQLQLSARAPRPVASKPQPVTVPPKGNRAERRSEVAKARMPERPARAPGRPVGSAPEKSASTRNPAGRIRHGREEIGTAPEREAKPRRTSGPSRGSRAGTEARAPRDEHRDRTTQARPGTARPLRALRAADASGAWAPERADQPEGGERKPAGRTGRGKRHFTAAPGTARPPSGAKPPRPKGPRKPVR